jgi:hypothetical protein
MANKNVLDYIFPGNHSYWMYGIPDCDHVEQSIYEFDNLWLGVPFPKEVGENKLPNCGDDLLTEESEFKEAVDRYRTFLQTRIPEHDRLESDMYEKMKQCIAKRNEKYGKVFMEANSRYKDLWRQRKDENVKISKEESKECIETMVREYQSRKK